MYNPQKLSKLAKQMITAKSDQRIMGLAQEEYTLVTLISDKIEQIAQQLRTRGLLTQKQSQHLKEFRKHVYFLHFALQDIIHNKTKRPIQQKVEYLQNMLASYKKELKLLEKELGEEIKHVKGAVDKLKNNMSVIEQIE